jgi:hypothetical protein
VGHSRGPSWEVFILILSLLSEVECDLSDFNIATPASVAPPPPGPRGETHSLAGEGLGGPNSDEETDTLVLFVYYNPSTLVEPRTVEILALTVRRPNHSARSWLRVPCFTQMKAGF